MSVITLRERLSLIFFGLGLAFLLLEAGLRLGGWLFLSQQDRLNRRASFQGQEVRILCLGESTTAIGGENSFPFQLQQILQERRPQIRWVVINRGLVSTTSADILAQLDANLQKYQPHIVVTMLGINDRALLPRQDVPWSRVKRVLRHSRVYHLFELLAEHLAYKFKARPTAMDQAPQTRVEDLDKMTRTLVNLEKTIQKLEEKQRKAAAPSSQLAEQLQHLRLRQVLMLVGMGDYFIIRGQFDQAKKVLLTALEIAPENYVVLLELARCLRTQGQCEEAVPLLLRAAQLKPALEGAWVNLERCYADLGMDLPAYALAQKILKRGVQQNWVYQEIGSWLLKKGYLKESEEFLKAALERNTMDVASYFSLAEVYEKTGNSQLAREFREKGLAQQKANEDYLPQTVDAYRRIAEKILGRQSRLVVMQYPLRRLEPLKEIFPKGGPILFVENRQNFLKAFTVGRYEDYFSDNFAGDFGHCKRSGNRLIAHQLADVILQEIFPQGAL